MDTLKDQLEDNDGIFNSMNEEMKNKIRIKAEQANMSINEYMQKIKKPALDEIGSDPNYKL
jgi:hypothetical protein